VEDLLLIYQQMYQLLSTFNNNKIKIQTY